MHYPLTGNGDLDKDLAEEHERDLLEEVQADHIAEGDLAALDAENYQPLTEDEDEFLDTRESNRFVHGAQDYVGRKHVNPVPHEQDRPDKLKRDER